MVRHHSDHAPKVLTKTMSIQEWTRKNASIVGLRLTGHALRAQAKLTNMEAGQTSVFIVGQLQLDHALKVQIKFMKNNQFLACCF